MTLKDCRHLFGKRVIADQKYSRKEEWQGNAGHHKIWLAQNAKVQGLFIGTRTYHEGHARYWPDESPEWRRCDSLEVGLIVPGPRQNAVPVPIESIREASDEPD